MALIHTCYRITDIDRSVAFYKALGFEEIGRVPIRDSYIRISRVNEREGAEYRSPDLQREDIRRWAEVHRVKLGKEVVDEDTSGGVPQTDRGVEELLRRAEAGESEGIITSYFKR